MKAVVRLVLGRRVTAYAQHVVRTDTAETEQSRSAGRELMSVMRAALASDL